MAQENNMTELPPVFARNGDWQGLSSEVESKLDENRKALYLDLERAVGNAKATEMDLQEALARVKMIDGEIEKTREFIAEHFPRDPSSDFQKLWKDNFGRN